MREHDLLEELHAGGSWSNGRQNVLVGDIKHGAVQNEPVEAKMAKASPVVSRLLLVLVVIYF